LADEIQTILKNEFNLNSTIKKRPEKNIQEVICCNVRLSNFIKQQFGKGAAGKKIPEILLRLNENIQNNLVQGYLDGDGDFRNAASTVSKCLAYSLYALAIQCNLYPSIQAKKAAYSIKGVNHKEAYRIQIKKREGTNGFYEKINGNKYYLSKIINLENLNEKHKVIDISVEKTNSFTTKLGVVHNCNAKGDAIEFERRMIQMQKDGKSNT
jgi:intein/homing endonuclease